MVALLKDTGSPWEDVLGPVHAPYDHHDAARPLSWGEVEEVVTPPLLAAAVEQVQILKATGQMRNLRGKLNDTRTQVVGKLGELVVARYYRRCGLAAELAAFREPREGYRRYDHERDRYDLLLGGWRKTEVKTLHRTVKAQPSYIAHLNRTEANIRRDDIFCFCSFYTRENEQGEMEDVVQYLGWLAGDMVLRLGTFYHKGECAPLDGGFCQRVDNYVLRYDSLHHPHWLYGNKREPFSAVLQDEYTDSLRDRPFDPLVHIGWEAE